MSGSWQGYLSNEWLGSSNLASAMIIGLDGTVLAASPGFSLKAGEGAAIVAIFSNPSAAFASGVTVGGVNYLVTTSNGQSIYGQRSANGVAIAKTNQAVAIGYYSSPMQAGPAAQAVESTADYMRSCGQ